MGEEYSMFVPRNKPYRRRKKHEGETWHESLPKELDAKNRDRGLQCRECGKLKPWSKMHLHAEMQGETLVRMWVCNDCGNVLQEDEVITEE